MSFPTIRPLHPHTFFSSSSFYPPPPPFLTTFSPISAFNDYTDDYHGITSYYNSFSPPFSFPSSPIASSSNISEDDTLPSPFLFTTSTLVSTTCYPASCKKLLFAPDLYSGFDTLTTNTSSSPCHRFFLFLLLYHFPGSHRDGPPSYNLVTELEKDINKLYRS